MFWSHIGKNGGGLLSLWFLSLPLEFKSQHTSASLYSISSSNISGLKTFLSLFKQEFTIFIKTA